MAEVEKMKSGSVDARTQAKILIAFVLTSFSPRECIRLLAEAIEERGEELRPGDVAMAEDYAGWGVKLKIIAKY